MRKKETTQNQASDQAKRERKTWRIRRGGKKQYGTKRTRINEREKERKRKRKRKEEIKGKKGRQR